MLWSFLPMLADSGEPCPVWSCAARGSWVVLAPPATCGYWVLVPHVDIKGIVACTGPGD